MSAVAEHVDELIGRKGGGKGGGGSARTPREDPNTLRSNSTARIIDLLGEGPILGLVNGLNSVLLDGTPVKNDDGSFNFEGMLTAFRDGSPVQAPFPRQTGIEDENDVSVQVTTDVPLVRRIEDPNTDEVRVTVQLPALTYRDLKTGDLEGTTLEYAIDVRSDGGDFVEKKRDKIEGKTTSPYQRDQRVPLHGSPPWDIRVRRITPDAESSNISNDLYWASYTEIINAKLTFPNSALMGIEIDARQFGAAIPSRAYDIYGLIISVPSNYNPETREYAGLWDGTFKQAWTDNPAWVYYDLATNKRYGAGLPFVDKWSLYTIGQYCDELVPDGFGGMEPRYTFNSLIAERSGVYKALNQIASVFRGMSYWGSNTVMPVADMPGTPVKNVTPANVIGGEFEYAGASRAARHSVALVSYNDPDAGDRLQPEVVERPDLIEQLGWRPLDMTAIGCNSRGQAHRMGEWALDTEQNEGETVSYRATTDHADVRPGDLIYLTDPNRAGARLGGRFLATGTQNLTLDKVPDIVSNGDVWYLDATLPSGGIERREISDFDGNDVTLDTPLSQRPVSGAVWILSSASVAPRQFRIVDNQERSDDDGGLEHVITGVEHDPTKYARVEQGIAFDLPPDSLVPTGPIAPPTNLTVESYTYLAGGTQHQGLTVSLTPSADARVQQHIIEVRGPADSTWRTLSNAVGTSAEQYDATPGEWQVRARATDGIGRRSAWVYRTVTVNGLLLPGPPDSVDITVGTFSAQINPNGLLPGAVWEFWLSSVALLDEQIESNAVRVGVGSSIAIGDPYLSPNTLYYLYIRGKNVYGESDWYPLQFTTDNDPTKVMAAVSKARWTGTTAYVAAAVVSPTPGNRLTIAGVPVAFQADNAGTSGGSEPAWSSVTALGDTVLDNGITWRAIDASDSPFLIVDGRTYIDTAMIEEASIKSAMIETLLADEITAGILRTAEPPDPRLEMSFDDDGYLFWSGSGAKTVANAKFYVDQNGNFIANDGYFRGDIEATGIKAGTANIIETLMIQDNAVTVPIGYQYDSPSNQDSDVFVTMAPITIPAGTFQKTTSALVLFGFDHKFAVSTTRTANRDARIDVRLYISGSKVFETVIASATIDANDTPSADLSGPYSFARKIDVGAGATTIELKARFYTDDDVDTSARSASNRFMTVIGLQK